MRHCSLLLAAVVAAGVLAVAPGAAAPAQTPKRGGTVVVAWPVPEPPCVNPFGPCPGFVHGMFGLVLPGAFTIGPDLRHRPNLVSRADIVSKTPFVVVYRIRPEARWSDGVPVTASDFVFTHRIFRDHQLTAGFDVRPFYGNIRQVVPVDAKTVRVVFRERDGFWRLLFHLILPRHALAGEEITAVWRTGIDNPKTGRAIGSGPFLFGGWQRGREITLVRNPRYWGTRTAHLDRLVARFPAAGLSSAEALRSRHADVLETIVTDPAEVGALRGITGVTVQSAAPALVLEHVALRLGPGGHPALKNKLVRRALAHGLDRNALARARSGDARLKTDNAVIARNSRFYQPNWGMYRFDPARARRLLEQAGCRRGADGTRVCAGERLRLRFSTTAGNEGRRRTLELAQRQLGQIGVEVVPSYGTPGGFFFDILPSGDFDVALFSHTSINGVFYWAGCGFDNNFTGYCSRLTNRDLAQMNRIVDERQRARVLNAADAKLARDVPAIPLTQLPFIVAHRSNIRNVVPNPSLTWWNAENWWLDD